MTSTASIPHTAGRISRRWLQQTLRSGCRGFLHTSLPWWKGENLQLIRQAKRQGLAINWQAGSEAAADAAVAAGIPTLVMAAPGDARQTWQTPAGNLVVACPGHCAACGLCSDRSPRLIVAMPAA